MLRCGDVWHAIKERRVDYTTFIEAEGEKMNRISTIIVSILMVGSLCIFGLLLFQRDGVQQQRVNDAREVTDLAIKRIQGLIQERDEWKARALRCQAEGDKTR